MLQKTSYALFLTIALWMCSTTPPPQAQTDSTQIQPFPITDVVPVKPDPYKDQDYELEGDDPLGDYRGKKRSNGDKPGNNDKDTNKRVGALCNDGTQSGATGRGACAGHGGVKEWLYENSPKPRPGKSGLPPNHTMPLPELTIPENADTATVSAPALTPSITILGQVAIAILVFLLMFLLVKKTLEKI